MLAQVVMAYYFDPKVESIGQAFEMVNYWQVSRSVSEDLIPWRVLVGRIGKATASGDVFCKYNSRRLRLYTGLKHYKILPQGL